MSDFVIAFKNGNLDRAEQILCARFPDAPPNTMSAVTALLFVKGVDVESFEPRLEELVDKIKSLWEEKGW